MNDEKRATENGGGVSKVRVRRYVSALLALGLTAGATSVTGSRTLFAEDNAQAVNPVDVTGSKSTAPDAAVPSSTPSTPPAPAAPIANTPPAAPAETPVAAQPAPVASPPSPAIAAPAAAAAAPSAAGAAPAEAGVQAVSPVDVSKTPAPDVTTAPAAPAAPAPEPAPAIATTPETAPATAPSAGPVAAATSSAAVAIKQDGEVYPCTGIKISYFKDHPGEPPVADLLNTPMKLGVVPDGLVAPRSGVPIVMIKLGDIGKSAPWAIYGSGIKALYAQLVRALNERGIVGVFVVVDKEDIDARDNDVRPKDRTTLQFIVVTSIVKQVRTLATGNNVAEGERVNNPRHAAIRNNSPLQGGPGHDDLLNKDALDEYVMRLNRMPGRRVDVAVSGNGQIGGVNLDYLVSENRPWYVYAQVSNTGTSQTNNWRERFGFVDNQLTGHDDILSLDYITAGFDASQSFIGSYGLPFFSFDRIRYRLYGSWDDFTASDVGQAKEQFTGSDWIVGNELVWNFFQKRELFIDAVGGFRFEGMESNNKTSATSGQATYFTPYGGFKLERSTELATTTASTTFFGYLTNATQADVQGLNRTPVSVEPILLSADATQSLFLEPFLDPEGFATGQGTLANELYFRAHGQYGFDSRFFPQAEDVAGGFYTVRGYPESIIAGDSAFVVSAEYQLHIPRLFPVQPDPNKTPFLWDKSFRVSPQQPYGHPDWDLIARTFIDVGRVVYTDHQPSERNGTLIGTGVGLELQYKQNLNIRVDWGIALNALKSQDATQSVSEGSNRFNIAATFLY